MSGGFDDELDDGCSLKQLRFYDEDRENDAPLVMPVRVVKESTYQRIKEKALETVDDAHEGDAEMKPSIALMWTFRPDRTLLPYLKDFVDTLRGNARVIFVEEHGDNGVYEVKCAVTRDTFVSFFFVGLCVTELEDKFEISAPY